MPPSPSSPSSPPNAALFVSTNALAPSSPSSPLDAALVTSANTSVPSSLLWPSGAVSFVSADTSAPSFSSSLIDAVTANYGLIKCISFNSRRIANKITDLNYLLETKHPDCVFISGTW